MSKELGKQHPVESSNIQSIGFYKSDSPNPPLVRVVFQRGAQYDYWPCSEKEFQEAFAPGVIIKDWFAEFKIDKNYKVII